MKVAYCSDLHFRYILSDFEIEKILNCANADVLVIAGDLTTNIDIIKDTLQRLSNKIDHIIYVPGNHEFWGSNIAETCENLNSYKFNDNVHVLINKSVVINDLKFVGAIGWPDGTFKEINKFFYRGYLDFKFIKDFKNYINKKCDVNFIKSEVDCDKQCIVITHFVPYIQFSRGTIFEGDHLNPCFYNDWRKYFYDFKNIPFWIYGHNHFSATHKVDDITFVNYFPKTFSKHFPTFEV